MTLQELLNLKIIHDNVHILISGLEDSEEEFHANRILGRHVTKEDLVKAGMKEEYFSYKVESIWGDKHPFKMGIVIKEY